MFSTEPLCVARCTVEPPRITFYLRLRDCEFTDSSDLAGQILDCVIELKARPRDPFLLPDPALALDLVMLAHHVIKYGEVDFQEYLDKFVLGGVYAFMNEKRAERNSGAKVEDGATVAIAAAVQAIEAQGKQIDRKAPFSAKLWAAAIATGTSRPVSALLLKGAFDAHWPAPPCKAADVVRLITSRCKRKAVKKDGAVINGYCFDEIAKEFV